MSDHCLCYNTVQNQVWIKLSGFNWIWQSKQERQNAKTLTCQDTGRHWEKGAHESTTRCIEMDFCGAGEAGRCYGPVSTGRQHRLSGAQTVIACAGAKVLGSRSATHGCGAHTTALHGPRQSSTAHTCAGCWSWSPVRGMDPKQSRSRVMEPELGPLQSGILRVCGRWALPRAQPPRKQSKCSHVLVIE
jgi:hypothetical protein